MSLCLRVPRTPPVPSGMGADKCIIRLVWILVNFIWFDNFCKNIGPHAGHLMFLTAWQVPGPVATVLFETGQFNCAHFLKSQPTQQLLFYSVNESFARGECKILVTVIFLPYDPAPKQRVIRSKATELRALFKQYPSRQRQQFALVSLSWSYV